MIFLIKNPKKLISVAVLLILTVITLLALISCSLFAGIGNVYNGGNKNYENLCPSFSGSNIEFIDVNGGDTYPGEELDINIAIVNNGNLEAKNVKVKLNPTIINRNKVVRSLNYLGFKAYIRIIS